MPDAHAKKPCEICGRDGARLVLYDMPGGGRTGANDVLMRICGECEGLDLYNYAHLKLVQRNQHAAKPGWADGDRV